MNIEEIEQAIRKEAEKLVHDEPLSVLMLTEQVLNCKDFAAMLSVTLSCQLAGEVMDRAELEKMFDILYLRYPELLICACKDLHATVLRDPACTSYLEPLLFFKGFQGLQAYRAAHALWLEGRSFPAKMIQSIVTKSVTVS